MRSHLLHAIIVCRLTLLCRSYEGLSHPVKLQYIPGCIYKSLFNVVSTLPYAKAPLFLNFLKNEYTVYQHVIRTYV